MILLENKEEQICLFSEEFRIPRQIIQAYLDCLQIGDTCGVETYEVVMETYVPPVLLTTMELERKRLVHEYFKDTY